MQLGGSGRCWVSMTVLLPRLKDEVEDEMTERDAWLQGALHGGLSSQAADPFCAET